MHRRPEPRIARILCPTDFSDFSRNALAHGVTVAAAYGASMTALHVMPQTLMHPELFPYIREPILVPPEIRERAQARLDELETEVEIGEVPFEAVLESGEAAHRILDYARSLPADLVVVGTRGRGGLERLVLGSVTERLLWKSRVPTLVVEEPPRRVEAGVLPYRRILTVSESGASTGEALDWACSFRRKAVAGEGALLLARVRTDGIHEEELEDGVELFDLDPVSPLESVPRFAAEREADLIVFESYGPLARELIRISNRPVLVMGHSSEESEEEN